MPQTPSAPSPGEAPAQPPIAHYLQAFYAALRECDVSMADFAAALRKVQVEAPEAWTRERTATATHAVAAALADITNKPHLGLLLAEAMPASAMGVLEYLLRTAPTMRATHALYERFAALFDEYVRHGVIERDGLMLVELLPLGDVPLGRVLEDFRLARMLSAARRHAAQPTATPTSVHFSYPRPDDMAHHQRVFGPQQHFVFRAARAGLVWPSQWAEQALPGHDPALHAILHEAATAQLQQEPRDLAVGLRLRHVLFEALHVRRPGVREIARQLGMSERTLRRRLREEDTSFDDILRFAAPNLRNPPPAACPRSLRMGMSARRSARLDVDGGHGSTDSPAMHTLRFAHLGTGLLLSASLFACSEDLAQGGPSAADASFPSTGPLVSDDASVQSGAAFDAAGFVGAAGSDAAGLGVLGSDAGQRSDGAVGAAYDGSTQLGGSDAGTLRMGFPPVADLTKNGPFATNNPQGENEGPSCSVHRPVMLGTGGVRHPVIVWGMGTGGFNTYQPSFDLWASHGFIVAASLQGQGQGDGTTMLACLKYVCDKYAANVDCRAGASGHSQGGGGAIMVGTDPRVVTTAPIQPYIAQGFGGYDQASIKKQVGPMLLLSGTADSIATPAQNQQPVFDTTNVPVVWANLVAGDHVATGIDGAAGYRNVVLAWFRLQLMNDQDFRPMFYGPDCTLCKDSAWLVQRKGVL